MLPGKWNRLRALALHRFDECDDPTNEEQEGAERVPDEDIHRVWSVPRQRDSCGQQKAAGDKREQNPAANAQALVNLLLSHLSTLLGRVRARQIFV